MLIPTGDDPNFSDKRPYVNWAIIALNTLVFVLAKFNTASDLDYQRWIVDWGFVPVAPRLETFFSSMFMHADFMHLAGNMLFLFIFGDNVEGRLGHVGYLLTYLACGLAAVLLFQVLDPSSGVPLVGASGAIFGVEGFYFLAFPKNRVRIIYWFYVIGIAWIPARVMLGFTFLLQLFLTLSARSELGGGGVAYAAHVGGFVFGLGAAVALRLAAGPEEAARYVPRARYTGAGGRGRRAPLRYLGGTGPQALLAQAGLLMQAGRPEAARVHLEKLLAEHAHEPEAPEAAWQLGMILAHVEHRPEAAREPLRFAANLHPDPARRAAAQQELDRLG